MNTRILFTTLIVVLVATVSNAQPPGGGWGDPVFFDEFEDTELNTSKWRYNTSTTEFSKDNVVLEDGIVSIHNLYPEGGEPTGGWFQSDKAGFVGDDKYGYYEARIRINAPATGQIWPTWWVWGGNWRDGGPAPTTTEFDIMEYSGWAAKYSDNYATTSHHYKAKKEINGVTHSTTSKESNATRNAFEWHTWGLLWTPTEVSFWYDGEKYFTSPEPEDAATEDIEMNLIFSCSPHIGSNPIEENKPQPGDILPSYQIDWVRVWQGGDPNYVGTSSAKSDLDMKVYPNPLTGDQLSLIVNVEESNVLNVNAYNYSGQLIGQLELGMYTSGIQNIQMDISDLGINIPGLYVVEVDLGVSSSRVLVSKR